MPRMLLDATATVKVQEQAVHQEFKALMALYQKKTGTKSGRNSPHTT